MSARSRLANLYGVWCKIERVGEAAVLRHARPQKNGMRRLNHAERTTGVGLVTGHVLEVLRDNFVH